MTTIFITDEFLYSCGDTARGVMRANHGKYHSINDSGYFMPMDLVKYLAENSVRLGWVMEDVLLKTKH